MKNLATRQKVLDEIAKVDELGVDQYLAKVGFKKPRGVYLVFNRRLYPARAIRAQARPKPLTTKYDNASMYHKRDAYFKLDSKFKLTSQTRFEDYVDSNETIEDFADPDFENDDPKYREIVSKSFYRSHKVRQAVLQRAGGHCELDHECVIFTTSDGRPYLETHHVLALSCQGADTEANVIALCPSHHRECHFGANWEPLQKMCLKAIRGKKS